MRTTAFLRTTEHEEAVRSLEWAELQARGLPEDPYLWKWVLVALHNAVQGYMVLALWNGNGLATLKPHIAAKWLKAYESGGPFPVEKLDDFLSLYAKVKNQRFFNAVGSRAFSPASSGDWSIEKLNELRNMFIHFTPKGWSLELAGLPGICLEAANLVEFLGCQSSAILWHRRGHLTRTERAIKRFRRALLAVGAKR